METQRITLPSLEEFARYPKLPGWKYEYINGVLEATPMDHSIATVLAVQPRSVAPPCDLVPADEGTQSELARVFIAAFADSVEFCNWLPQEIEEHAHAWIHAFFDGRRGQPLSVSRVAMADGTVVGTALFRNNDDIPFLDLLFILPEWQRQGIATALVGQAVNALFEARIPMLTSRYLLANAASRSWHARFGFVDAPGWLASRHLRAYYRQELHRRESLADLDPVESQWLNGEVAHWTKTLETIWGDSD